MGGGKGAGNDFSTLRPRSKVWMMVPLPKKGLQDYAHS